LQQYADQKLPPRSDILIKLARGANVSIDWLATGQGETRAAGQLLGATFADVAMDRTARDPCCNDRPFFLTAPFDQVRISRAAKFLLGHRLRHRDRLREIPQPGAFQDSRRV